MTATTETRIAALEARIAALEVALEAVLGDEKPKPKTEGDELAAAFKTGAEKARVMFGEERSA